MLERLTEAVTTAGAGASVVYPDVAAPHHSDMPKMCAANASLLNMQLTNNRVRGRVPAWAVTPVTGVGFPDQHLATRLPGAALPLLSHDPGARGWAARYTRSRRRFPAALGWSAPEVVLNGAWPDV
jgi:hypothetical protein